jgi:K+-sensing histidine kinase KdpD
MAGADYQLRIPATLDFFQRNSAFWQSKEPMRLRDRSRSAPALLDTAVGTLLCASAALTLALMFNQTRLKLGLPLICLAIVLALATRLGVATGVLGSIVSALLLAYFVYAPVHSFRIASSEARASLSWLLLGGISLSYLFTPRRDRSTKQSEEHRAGKD